MMMLSLTGLAQAGALTMSDVLSPYIYVFYAAFVISFIFTPVMRMVAMYYGIIDQPDNVRKMHKTPVAYLGGMAVFLGWMSGLATSQFLPLHRTEPGQLVHVLIAFGIVAGACVIVLLGLWDDVISVRPRTKIVGQIFSAAFLLASGIGTHCAAPLLEPIGQRLGIILFKPSAAPLLHLTQWFFGGWPYAAAPTFFPEWFLQVSSCLLVVMVVVGCCNAANLMDGLDGLCGGVTAIISGGFLFLAVHLAATGSAQNTNWDAMRIVLALALLGGVMGFIPYNFNPASIFMGDTGSMFLGFACATLMLLMAEGEHPKWFLASMVIFALPVMDTALAFVRRWVAGRPFYSADRQHIHHQLVARGFTIKQTVLISYGLALLFAFLGIAIVFIRTRFAGAIYLVVFGSIIVAAYKMGMVQEKPTVVESHGLSEADIGMGQMMADQITPANALDVKLAGTGTVSCPSTPAPVGVPSARH
jgi:UDP-GlcNAc:undecaprenyl-phosphate GlcNAc-1-phosphate transferase